MPHVYVIDKDDRLRYITDDLNAVDCNMPVRAKSVHGNRLLTLVLDFDGDVWRCDVIPGDEMPTFEFIQMRNLCNIVRIGFDSDLHDYYLIDDSDRVFVRCSIHKYLNRWDSWYHSPSLLGWLMRLFNSRPGIDDILPVKELALPIVDDETVTIKKLIYHYSMYFLLDMDGGLWTKSRSPSSEFELRITEIECIVAAPGYQFNGVWMLRRTSDVLSFSYHDGIGHHNWDLIHVHQNFYSDDLIPIIYFDRDDGVVYEITGEGVDPNPVMRIASSELISPHEIFDIQQHGRFVIVLLQSGQIFIRQSPHDYFCLVSGFKPKRLLNYTGTDLTISRTKNARSI